MYLPIYSRIGKREMGGGEGNLCVRACICVRVRVSVDPPASLSFSSSPVGACMHVYMK